MKLIGKRALVVLLLAGLGILLGIRLTRGHAPEVEVIGRTASPGGIWAAKVEMVIYGDRWFVNDARYEVRIERADGHAADVLVYSVQASGPTGLAVQWRGDDDLVIEDSSSALHDAVKQPHPLVRIAFHAS